MAQDQVAAEFERLGYRVLEPEVLDQCLNLAGDYGLSAKQVAAELDILWGTKPDGKTEVRLVDVTTKAFKDHLATARKPHSKQPAQTGFKHPLTTWDNMSDREVAAYQPTPKRPALGLGATPGSKGGSLLGLPARTPLPHTPYSQQRTPVPGAAPGRTAERSAHCTPSASASKFDSMRTTAKGELVCVLNEHLPDWEAPTTSSHISSAGVKPVGPQLPVVGSHTFMMDTLDNRVQAMEDRLTDWAQHLAAANPAASDAGQQPLNTIMQEPAWCVGRVVLEANAEEGPAARLALSTLQLEGSRAACDGARVRLDVSLLGQPQGPAAPPAGARFFPGQVLGVQGVNPTGSTLVAHSVCSSLPAPLAPSPPSSTPSCLMVAAGPFTTNDELCFAPLDQLLQHCTARKPQVLMLLGPFLDASHAAVRSGMLDQSFDALFQEEVVQRITAWQAAHPEQQTQVVLVPSVSDVHHAPVLPTPAFHLPAAAATAPGGAPRGMVSLQNPCMFSLASGGITVGCSSTDVLKALSGGELAVGAAGTDRLAALAGQLVGQRSWFPVFPAPLGTCLDLSHAAGLQISVTPHIMLLPSDLAPFAKLLPLPQPRGATADQAQQRELQQVVCVNPGRVVRGATPGTFAVVCVQPGAAGVAARCRAEVRRM